MGLVTGVSFSFSTYGGFFIVIVAFKRRQVIDVIIIVVVAIVVDAEAELDETVNAVGEGHGLVEGEARSEEGGVVEEPDEVLVGLVSLGLLAQGGDDGVGGVDLHGLLGAHVGALAGVAEGLGLHDTLHVGGPAVLASLREKSEA